MTDIRRKFSKLQFSRNLCRYHDRHGRSKGILKDALSNPDSLLLSTSWIFIWNASYHHFICEMATDCSAAVCLSKIRYGRPITTHTRCSQISMARMAVKFPWLEFRKNDSTDKSVAVLVPDFEKIMVTFDSTRVIWLI